MTPGGSRVSGVRMSHIARSGGSGIGLQLPIEGMMEPFEVGADLTKKMVSWRMIQ